MKQALGVRSLYVAYYIWDDLKDSRSSDPDNWSLAYYIQISGLSFLRFLCVLVFPKKGKCIDTQNHNQQRSDWLAARQERNDIISLKKTPDEKLDTFLDIYKETAKRTKRHKCYNREMKCALFLIYL